MPSCSRSATTSARRLQTAQFGGLTPSQDIPTPMQGTRANRTQAVPIAGLASGTPASSRDTAVSGVHQLGSLEARVAHRSSCSPVAASWMQQARMPHGPHSPPPRGRISHTRPVSQLSGMLGMCFAAPGPRCVSLPWHSSYSTPFARSYLGVPQSTRM